MIPSFEVTVPPLRSGAKIGSFRAYFQAFCSYYFHFGPNSLSEWKILFGFWPGELQRKAKKADPAPEMETALPCRTFYLGATTEKTGQNIEMKEHWMPKRWKPK